jgi:aspartate/methionine/tyrosine aminotransferase
VIADEIYALAAYEIGTFTSMGTIYPEGTFVTNRLSKDRSAGGYHLGSVILLDRCSEKLIEAFTKVDATVYTNVYTSTQYAAVTAYLANKEIEEYFRINRVRAHVWSCTQNSPSVVISFFQIGTSDFTRSIASLNTRNNCVLWDDATTM